MILSEKYMLLSKQSFPYTTSKYLKKVFEKDNSNNDSNQNEKETNDLDTIIKENGIICEETEINIDKLLNKDDDSFNIRIQKRNNKFTRFIFADDNIL
jgi:hypothetical protein